MKKIKVSKSLQGSNPIDKRGGKIGNASALTGSKCPTDDTATSLQLPECLKKELKHKPYEDGDLYFNEGVERAFEVLVRNGWKSQEQVTELMNDMYSKGLKDCQFSLEAEGWHDCHRKVVSCKDCQSASLTYAKFWGWHPMEECPLVKRDREIGWKSLEDWQKARIQLRARISAVKSMSINIDKLLNEVFEE